MKNILGEEIKFKPLEFEWTDPVPGFPQWHLWVNRGGKMFCHVSPNGWTGYSKDVYHKLGEPMIDNLTTHNISFADMNQIMGAYWSKITPRQIMDGIIRRLAIEKKVSIDQAIAYIAEQKIECIST